MRPTLKPPRSGEENPDCLGWVKVGAGPGAGELKAAYVVVPTQLAEASRLGSGLEPSIVLVEYVLGVGQMSSEVEVAEGPGREGNQ